MASTKVKIHLTLPQQKFLEDEAVVCRSAAFIREAVEREKGMHTAQGISKLLQIGQVPVVAVGGVDVWAWKSYRVWLDGNMEVGEGTVELFGIGEGKDEDGQTFRLFELADMAARIDDYSFFAAITKHLTSQLRHRDDLTMAGIIEITSKKLMRRPALAGGAFSPLITALVAALGERAADVYLRANAFALQSELEQIKTILAQTRSELDILRTATADREAAAERHRQACEYARQSQLVEELTEAMRSKDAYILQLDETHAAQLEKMKLAVLECEEDVAKWKVEAELCSKKLAQQQQRTKESLALMEGVVGGPSAHASPLAMRTHGRLMSVGSVSGVAFGSEQADKRKKSVAFSADGEEETKKARVGEASSDDPGPWSAGAHIDSEEQGNAAEADVETDEGGSDGGAQMADRGTEGLNGEGDSAL